MTNILDNRATSSFTISIGTALALESLFKGDKPVYDNTRVIPEQVNLQSYDSFYINVFTLYRNILGSVDTKLAVQVSANEIVEVLENEIELIKSLVYASTQGKTKVVLYASEYKGLVNKHPHAFIQKPTTDRQMFYNAKMQETINKFIQTQNKENIQLYSLELIPTVREKSLILTNYAYDLLSFNKFSQLDLLESHTGILKTKNLFYTKLTKGKELIRIPFNNFSIQVFGDSNTFSPQPNAIRTKVIELSEQYSWTQLTTKDRLVYCFNAMPDKMLGMILKDML
jgi:hypothetical protein